MVDEVGDAAGFAPGILLWAGTLGQHSFEQRLAAAAGAQCRGMSVFPWECWDPESGRNFVAKRHAQALEHDVQLSALDPVTTWLPDWRVPDSRGSALGERNRYAAFFGAFELEECLAAAAGVGATSVSLIEPHGRSVPAGLGAEAFARACDLGSEHGLQVQLEFMPFSGVPDLSTAWEIVRLADRPNGGLVLDTWHLFRTGPAYDLLRTIPSHRIFSVQLSDGPPPPEPDLWHAAAHERLLPGAGAFDLATVLQILVDGGCRAAVGPEVVSDLLAALDPVEAAKLATDAVRSLLEHVAS